MSRPKKYRISVHNLLTEVFTKKIETSFREIDYSSYVAYQFKTNSGNLYDLEFHHSKEDCYTELNNGIILGDLLKKRCSGKYIDSFSVSFTTSYVINKDNPDEYEKETNIHEQYELMGRLVYIIYLLLKKFNNYKLFVIVNSRRNKMDIYKTIFENHFKERFNLYVGDSINSDEGKSFFIIRK